MNSKFQIGDMVVLNSHPLLNDYVIDEYFKLTSPILSIKEIAQEAGNNIFSSEIESSQIADKIKYTCVFFDTNSTSFKEILIYESLVSSFKDLKFHSNNGKQKENLITEVDNYTTADYQYGSLVCLKSLKLELRKKYNNPNDVKSKSNGLEDKTDKKQMTKSKVQYPPFTSPRFILSGISRNKEKNIKNKRKVAKILYKVSWFNSKDNKISQELLPNEFFTTAD